MRRADRGDDREPLHDVGVQRLAPQIEEAVLQAHVLRIVGLAEHRQRQLLGRATSTSISVANSSTSPVGSSALTVPSGRVAHAAVNAHHPLGAQRLGDLERGTVGIGHDLGDARSGRAGR